MSWLSEKNQKVMLHTYVQPGASKSEIQGIHDGRLKIRIQSLPVDGKANVTLIEFLAKLLKIPKKSIVLVSGVKSRIKDLEVSGATTESVKKIFEGFL